MDIHSLMTFAGFIGVMCIFGIQGVLKKRLFRGKDVPLLYDKDTAIIDEIHTNSAGLCAVQCAITECEAFLFREPGTTWPDDYCYDSPDRYGYIGHLATTFEGRTCQRWDSQTPYAHSATTEYIPEATLQEAENYCRDTMYFGTPWCYTTDLSSRWEACDVIKCIISANNCRLYNLTSTPYRTWSGYSYFQGVDP